ncbi:MAG: hypothetical protein KAS40_24540, partial [Desulfobacterales bacterium]|nr:hypothetical protein [Desulfobacterales bacterium]
KTLGTFTDYDAKPSANPASPAAATAAPGITDHHFQPLEGKIQLLDDKIADLKERLDVLSNMRTERDDIVIELFRMLKESLDSRMQFLTQVDEASNSENISGDEDDANDKAPPKSSKVSSLKRHKQKKK